MPPFLADVLTWPGNRFYITVLKAAQKNAIPPTVLLLKGRQPSDGWTPIDKKLVIAFQILEDETCNDCGVPIWIGHSDDESVVFEIKSRTCYACAEIESEQEREEKRSSKRKRGTSKGKKRFLADANPDKHPSREKYFKREAGIVDD